MTKKQNNEPTLFYDELKAVYNDKILALDKQIKNAQEDVECNKKKLATCPKNEIPEWNKEVSESDNALEELKEEKRTLLVNLKNLER